MLDGGNKEILVKQAESHVIILLLGLLLLFLGGRSVGRSSSAGGGSASSGSGTDSGANGGDELLQVGRLQGLGEESGPVRLEVDSSSLQDCNNLLGGDGNVIVSEDEGGVDAGEFRRHGDGAQVSNVDLAQREQGTRILL